MVPPQEAERERARGARTERRRMKAFVGEVDDDD
jgi:hypothetical protein